MEKDIITQQWNSVAENYSAMQKNAKNDITNKTIIKEIIGDVNGLKVLDAGCGDGSLSSELKSLGADTYAFDGSEKFIEIAKNKYPSVPFKVCDIKKTLPYENSFFDIVVSSLVLMDIDNIEPFLSESHRILKENGRLIFSIVHPSFFQAEWEYGENGEKLVKKIKNYWDCNSEILNIWGETTHFHRPLTWYSKLIKKCGFVIEEISEAPENKEVFDNMKQHQKRIPLFLCFSLKKI